MTPQTVDPEVYQETDLSDVEADSDTLASCGWGTDEDYGGYGDCLWEE